MSAAVMFTMPGTGGQYEFRLFSDNSFSRAATSPQVIVTSPVLTPNLMSANAGTAVMVSVTNGPGNPKDWIGLYRQGAADTQYLAWQYLNGAMVAPNVGLTTATVTFTMPPLGGPLEVRLFSNNSFTRLAISPTVSVTPDVRGIYSAQISGTQSGCSDPTDDGSFSAPGTLSIGTQTGGTFSGAFSGTPFVSGFTPTTPLSGIPAGPAQL